MHLIPNGACENIVYTQPELRELMEERKFCIVITMSFSNSPQAVQKKKILFFPDLPLLTLQA